MTDVTIKDRLCTTDTVSSSGTGARQMIIHVRSCGALLTLLITMCVLSGCASINGPTDPHDPLERYNRAMYRFNDTIDKAILKPVAKGYVAVVPQPVNKGISNFFSNLDDVLILINNALQLKLAETASDTLRLFVNTTIGVLGFIDVATPMGLQKHNEDFGQTLGRWGVGSGPYLVLPFFGSSSPRDGMGLYVDYSQFNLTTTRVDENASRNALLITDTIDSRASLLPASRILETAALDPYTFTRESYLQRRRHLVYDGNPPPEEFETDPTTND